MGPLYLAQIALLTSLVLTVEPILANNGDALEALFASCSQNIAAWPNKNRIATWFDWDLRSRADSRGFTNLDRPGRKTVTLFFRTCLKQTQVGRVSILMMTGGYSNFKNMPP